MFRNLPPLLICLSLPLSVLAEVPEIDAKLKAKADGGDTSDPIKIGMMRLENSDFDGAESWFMKALKGEDKDAEEYLATLYDNPDNPKNDPEKAFTFRRLVAERGDSDSQVLLAGMYERGHGVKQSYKDAAIWYRKAAEQGDSRGTAGLSRIYSSGGELRHDDVDAYAATETDAHNFCRTFYGLTKQQMVERLGRPLRSIEDNGMAVTIHDKDNVPNTYALTNTNGSAGQKALNTTESATLYFYPKGTHFICTNGRIVYGSYTNSRFIMRFDHGEVHVARHPIVCYPPPR